MRRTTVAVLLSLLVPALAAADGRPVQGGSISFSLAPGLLADFGLALEAVPAAGRASGPDAALAFETWAPAGMTARVQEGRFVSYGLGLVLEADGGFDLVAPEGRIALDGFELVLAPEAAERWMTVRADGRDVFRIRDAFPSVHPDGIHYTPGDVFLSAPAAAALGRPGLADVWLGTVDVSLAAPQTPHEDVMPPLEDKDLRGGSTLDVLLGELYGITSQGHIGSYPNGTVGMSAATTSCNAGDVIVPWNSPMAETHPFIGLGVFRLKDGVLEQIGTNWLKHGFFALSNNQCGFGCQGSNGSYLGIGCSDTYSAGNNGNRTYLGPRAEVNPHTAEWEACGSYFDATPADCNRSYWGSGHTSVDHRIEIRDSDLGQSGATYFFEGVYYVADDENIANNIGWRGFTANWTGFSWNTNETGGVRDFTLGPVVSSWGNFRTSTTVASDDGLAVLSALTTDNGDGTWDYEYALYNRTSNRGFRSFKVGTGGATITNVGFHDFDHDAGSDWNATVANGVITWETDDFQTDPSANYIGYGTMYNFRFTADAAPTTTPAEGGLFRPGVGDAFAIDAPAPGPLPTDAPVLAQESELRVDPNPFSHQTRLSLAVRTAGDARVDVIDVTGRTVRSLLDAKVPAGALEVEWDGRDDAGRAVAAGVYFFRLQTADGVSTAKTTRLR